MSQAAILLTQLSTEIALLETENTNLKAQIASLQAQLPPTGIVKVVITDVDMSKVTFS